MPKLKRKVKKLKKFWSEATPWRPEVVEEVSVEELSKYTDPKTPPHGRRNPLYFKELARNIRRHGIKEPLILNYDPKKEQAQLGEGHHRLYIAQRLGKKTVPVRAMRWPIRNEGVPVRGFLRQAREHIPADLKPSKIGIKIKKGKGLLGLGLTMFSLGSSIKEAQKK